ncbi:hypothetical protein [Paraburkholderia sp. J12]|uniref:hypothetical protein n=1 Tax=Paraburkholderia sp. J12 TaxID=2805432 RepID=UPI002ABE442B|nr:hypothetical protein [Paraburkholderia sp. J12]
MSGAVLLLAGCLNMPGPEGGFGRFNGPSFAALQQMCGGQPVDFGADMLAVYSATFDAYVANRHGKLSHEQYCGFQAALAQHYTSLGTSSDPQIRNQWVSWLNDQRATAITWRAAADPTLRSG